MAGLIELRHVQAAMRHHLLDVRDLFSLLRQQERTQRSDFVKGGWILATHTGRVSGLVETIREAARQHLVRMLFGLAQLPDLEEIVQARQSVMTVEGKSLTADLQKQSKSFDEFWEDADIAVIEDAYRRAARQLGADICRTYAEHLADQNSEADSREEALVEAHAEIAALGLVPDVKTYLDEGPTSSPRRGWTICGSRLGAFLMSGGRSTARSVQ